MSDKVYAVYSIPKSPEYRLEKMFKTKEGAKNWIKNKKQSVIDHVTSLCKKYPENIETGLKLYDSTIYDIQIEEICE